MLDSFVLSHSLGFDGEQWADMVEEVTDHDASHLHVVFLLLKWVNLIVFEQGLAENREAVLIDIVVHVVFDEAVETVKSLDAATNFGWGLLRAKYPLTHCLRLFCFGEIGEYLLNYVGDNIAIFVLA